MRNRPLIDSYWLVEQMTLVVNSPMPTGTVVDCAPLKRIAQDYVREVARRLKDAPKGRIDLTAID